MGSWERVLGRAVVPGGGRPPLSSDVHPRTPASGQGYSLCPGGIPHPGARRMELPREMRLLGFHTSA